MLRFGVIAQLNNGILCVFVCGASVRSFIVNQKLIFIAQFLGASHAINVTATFDFSAFTLLLNIKKGERRERERDNE